MTDRLFDPARTAFISIDMQNGVASHDSVPNSAADVIARVGEMVDAARAGGGLVVYVRTSFLPDESDALHPKMDVARPAKPVRPAGWDQLVPAMQPLPTEPVIVKRSFDAFYGGDLADQQAHSLEAAGSAIRAEDFRDHRSTWTEPRPAAAQAWTARRPRPSRCSTSRTNR